MCEGFCTNTTPSTGSQTQNQAVVVQNTGVFQLSPVEALQNEAFLSAFFLPLAFYFMGWSKGIVLKLLKGI